MIILSVDYDYFFPCSEEYDWGNSEELSREVNDCLWHIRCYNRGLLNSDFALNAYNPDVKKINNFFDIVCANTINPSIVLADSHSLIASVIKALRASPPIRIWNFDQHHDLGYTSRIGDSIDCGNWAARLSPCIDEYNLIYPEWREEKKEFSPSVIPSSIGFNHDLPIYPDFDIIFVCRSSAWTASWCDDSWLMLLKKLEKRYPLAYSEKIAIDYVLKKRKFNIEIAKKFKYTTRSIGGEEDD